MSIVIAARAKYNDNRIALVELNSKFYIKPYTGQWTMIGTRATEGDFHYLACDSLKELEEKLKKDK